MTGRVVAASYVGAVAALAATGFGSDSTALILVAFAATLPCGVPAIVGYYVTYGLLVQLPSADASSGWFPVAADIVGVIAVALAALGNVLLVQKVRR